MMTQCNHSKVCHARETKHTHTLHMHAPTQPAFINKQQKTLTSHIQSVALTVQVWKSCQLHVASIRNREDVRTAAVRVCVRACACVCRVKCQLYIYIIHIEINTELLHILNGQT